MPAIIHLSDIWEYTLVGILNDYPKSELGIMIIAWVKHNKLEDFNSLLNFNVDDFTPSGMLCYYKENSDSEVVTILPTTPLQELFNLQWYIQHLIDESEYDDDDDDLNNPLNKDNWLLQTGRKFMKYVIYNGHTVTHKKLDKNPVRPIIKANPHHKHHIDEGESATSTGLSEDSISATQRIPVQLK